MSIQEHYLQTASQLCQNYKGDIPLNLVLKQFFSTNKKYGSRDRKFISTLIYSYYRLGKTSLQIPADEKMVLALFLCSHSPNPLLAYFNEDWNSKTHLPLVEKLALTGSSWPISAIAPFPHLLCTAISPENYAAHFTQQPDLFVRARPGHKEEVMIQLHKLGWNFLEEEGTALRLTIASPVDKHFEINGQLTIQDLNSQLTGTIIQEIFIKNNFHPKNLWDCCAASGGKSIMMYDLFPGIQLFVSDIRQSILYNLEKRFKDAGIKKYQLFVADLSKPFKQPVASKNHGTSHSSNQQFNFILTDVPCSGSGTWSRTPEQLYFFDEKVLDEFASRQFAIASNACIRLQPGGWLVYITCSVFKKENEEVVEKLMQHQPLSLVHSQLLDGTQAKADSMFVAIMKMAES